MTSNSPRVTLKCFWSCVLNYQFHFLYLLGIQMQKNWIVNQGIIDLTRNGNLATFFSYVCNGKKIKELFASTLNGITASVRCVSSIIVVLNATLTRLVVAHANTKHSEKQKVRRGAVFLLVGTHKHLTSMAVFTVHAKTSLLYFSTIYAS